MKLQLEIQGNSGHFRFDVAGPLEPRLEPVWKAAANPPEVVEIREVWEVPGARLLSPDGSAVELWQAWTAFLARFRRRGQGFPVWVRLIRDPAGAAEVVWTLGPPTHERFRLEQLSAGVDELAPNATWNVLVPVTLVFSAVQRFADPNGIVGWEQETASRFGAGGLHVLEWRTRITTREGTSALEKARRFGRIDIARFGGSYTYGTNGADGIEVLFTDADEANARVPTDCVVLSRIQQWGIHVGTTGPGTSPTEIGYSVRTRLEQGQQTTTYRATARGPGALAWVERHRPQVPLDTSEVFHEEALRYAEGTWSAKSQAPNQPDTADPVRWGVQVEVSGGHVAFDFEPVVGGYPPVRFEGALLPWRLAVTLRGQRLGGEGKRAELKLPGLLPPPWRLDRQASRESEPFVSQHGTDPEGHLWAREASLVYWSVERPQGSPAEQIAQAPPVESYYL